MRLVRSSTLALATLSALSCSRTAEKDPSMAPSGPHVDEAAVDESLRMHPETTSRPPPRLRQETAAKGNPSVKSPVGAGLGAPQSRLAAPNERDQEEISREFNTEGYNAISENAFRSTASDPLSTFAIDVDTASYSNVRRFLSGGHLPPSGSVRIEEMINYFTYDYPQPTNNKAFSISTELTSCPWAPEHRLVHIGLQGRKLEDSTLPDRNLVFLIDVSGSMNEPNKLPLVKSSLRLLVEQLKERDRVSIVVYAGASGVVLPPTSGKNTQAILEAINRLESGGSTNGAQGIQRAYELARSEFLSSGLNRVILATDGDFNVGTTSQGELVRLIERERSSGVFLSVLGYGRGNLKDSTMELLADKGNGNYAYIDSVAEARKVLVEQAGATLTTVAKDVKIQVEFNPRLVQSYRLVGYENRALHAQDFNDDKKDGGEIGAGHSVTAIYEILPAGADNGASTIDPLKYQRPSEPLSNAPKNEWLTLKVRYKDPNSDTSKLTQAVLTGNTIPLDKASTNARFATAVASFGMILTQSDYRGATSFEKVRRLAESAMGSDPNGYRKEFLSLIEAARGLSIPTPAARASL